MIIMFWYIKRFLFNINKLKKKDLSRPALHQVSIDSHYYSHQLKQFCLPRTALDFQETFCIINDVSSFLRALRGKFSVQHRPLLLHWKQRFIFILKEKVWSEHLSKVQKNDLLFLKLPVSLSLLSVAASVLCLRFSLLSSRTADILINQSYKPPWWAVKTENTLQYYHIIPLCLWEGNFPCSFKTSLNKKKMLVVDTVPDFYAKHKNRTFSAVRIKDTIF